MEKLEEAGTRTTETVTISRAEYNSFIELKSQNEWLLEQLRLANRKRFGTSSEKTQEELPDQLHLFNEAEGYAAPPGTKTTAVAAHTRQKRSRRLEEALPENVPVEVVEHHLSAEERECPICGEIMPEIGKEVRRTLKIIPAQVSIREDWYYTYACRKCQNEGTETPVVKAEKTPAFLSGSYASPEAVAHIMTQKFCMGSPLYRQEQEWAGQGIRLSRQTMSNWILRSTEDWLRPVYDELHRRLVRQPVLRADETTLQALHEPGKKAQTKSYMWRRGHGQPYCALRVPAQPEECPRGEVPGGLYRVSACGRLPGLPQAAGEYPGGGVLGSREAEVRRGPGRHTTGQTGGQRRAYGAAILQ